MLGIARARTRATNKTTRIMTYARQACCWHGQGQRAKGTIKAHLHNSTHLVYGLHKEHSLVAGLKVTRLHEPADDFRPDKAAAVNDAVVPPVFYDGDARWLPLEAAVQVLRRLLQQVVGMYPGTATAVDAGVDAPWHRRGGHA